jgi:hypothetical protein
MLRVEAFCPICKWGAIGFRQCSDGKTIVLMCDECDAVWLDPQEIDSDHALFPAPPEFLVPTLECSVSVPLSHWATQKEITTRGWACYIAGESKALDET